LEYLLFVAYLILFAWLVTKIKFFTAAGLSQSQLIIVFLLKVMAGIFYGWMGIYYAELAQMADTWAYHRHSIYEYHLIWNNPNEYFTNIFHNGYEEGYSNFFGSSDSYWNDLKGNIFVKLLSIFNIFSFGHYYVNVIFYSFITLFGPIAIYRVMRDIFPGRKFVLLLATFLIPSFLYWASGLHKEGLIFEGIAFIIYGLYFSVQKKKTGANGVLFILTGTILLFLLRNFAFAVLFPAAIAWLIANKWPQHKLRIFLSVYLFFGILFFCSKYVDARLDFPQAVVNKQQAFLGIQGGRSNVQINEIEPNFLSFVKNTPQAITLSMVRPYPSDVQHLPSLAAAVEISLLLLLCLLVVFFRRKNGENAHNVIYFCIFFGLSMMLAIGFSNNNLGAIVRYRSIILPLLIIPLVMQIDWKKLLNMFAGITGKREVSQ
jgi:hypothetical protein